MPATAPAPVLAPLPVGPTPDPAEATIATMLRLRDDAVTRDLATDIRSFPDHIRSRMAQIYLECVTTHELRRNALRGRNPAAPAGTVLGTKPVPTARDHFVLTLDGHVIGPTQKPVKDATHWCDAAPDPAGWWRLPVVS